MNYIKDKTISGNLTRTTFASKHTRCINCVARSYYLPEYIWFCFLVGLVLVSCFFFLAISFLIYRCVLGTTRQWCVLSVLLSPLTMDLKWLRRGYCCFFSGDCLSGCFAIRVLLLLLLSIPLSLQRKTFCVY